MKFALAAAFLITLPALAALVYGMLSNNWYLVGAAFASLAINTLPFVAAGFLMKGRGDDLSH